MVALETPGCEFGSPAPGFSLMGTDYNTWSLQDCTGTNGTLVMFICNHCPYVKAILDRIVRDTNELLRADRERRVNAYIAERGSTG